MWGWIEDVEKSTSDTNPEAEVDHVPRRASLKKRLRPLPESVKTTASAVLKGSSSPLPSPSRLPVEQCFKLLNSSPLPATSLRSKTTLTEEP